MSSNADDFAVLISGRDRPRVVDVMQGALKFIESWCADINLDVGIDVIPNLPRTFGKTVQMTVKHLDIGQLT